MKITEFWGNLALRLLAGPRKWLWLLSLAAVLLLLNQLSSTVVLLDTTLFYLPEQAYSFWTGLDSKHLEAVQAANRLDLIFLTLYGPALAWFGQVRLGSKRLNLPSFATFVFDLLETSTFTVISHIKGLDDQILMLLGYWTSPISALKWASVGYLGICVIWAIVEKVQAELNGE